MHIGASRRHANTSRPAATRSREGRRSRRAHRRQCFGGCCCAAAAPADGHGVHPEELEGTQREETSAHFLRLATWIQARWRGRMARTRLNNDPEWQDAIKKMKRRGCVLQEMVATEEVYVHALEMLVMSYWQNERIVLSYWQNEQIFETSSRPGLSARDRRGPPTVRISAALFVHAIVVLYCTNLWWQESLGRLFQSVATILPCQQEFLQELRVGLQTGRVGSVFERFAPRFRVHSAFVAHYDASMVAAEQLRETSPPFRELMERAREDHLARPNRITLTGSGPASAWALFQDLLIRPVQRLPRYCLLLESLRHHTDEAHMDHDAIVSALTLLKETATFVDLTPSHLGRPRYALPIDLATASFCTNDARM
eukprot:COSAG06_NODE_2697_length_6436_cov_8.420546_1_plen_370_part_00